MGWPVSCIQNVNSPVRLLSATAGGGYHVVKKALGHPGNLTNGCQNWGFWKRYYLSKMGILDIYLKIKGCNQHSTWTCWCCWKMILSFLLIRFFLSAITTTAGFPPEHFGVLTKILNQKLYFWKSTPLKVNMVHLQVDTSQSEDSQTRNRHVWGLCEILEACHFPFFLRIGISKKVP